MTIQTADNYYSQAADPNVVNFCQKLARYSEWNETVFKEWPGPLAHEAWRLKEVLEQGQIIGAIWQLKDLAEVMIKLPAVIMASDYLEHGSDVDTKNRISSFFFSKPLSMGSWLALAGDHLPKAILSEDQGAFVAPEIAGIFRQTKGKKRPSNAYELIREIVVWRNEELGHGAFRLQPEEFEKDLEEFITRINEVFSEHSEQGVWTNGVLRLNDEASVELRGAESIRKRHEEEKLGEHDLLAVEVDLACNEKLLKLSPFLSVKRCKVCRKMDVFFFDSFKDKQFFFLDYLAGHRMSRPRFLEASLAEHADKAGRNSGASSAQGLDETENIGKAFSRSVDELFMEKSLKSFYESPEYLRESLKDFIDNNDSGIFWLRAPAHCGKSVFVSGLLPKDNKNRPLVSGLKTAAFFIKREYKYHPAQFKENLKDAITNKNCLNLTAGRAELPDLELDTDNPAQAFAYWMSKLLKLRPETELLVCIDGLDELAKTKHASILDFIPEPDLLPQGLFILLTSRDQTECPEWVWKSIYARLDRDVGNVLCLDYHRNGQPYIELIRRYYYKQLTERIHERIIHSLTSSKAKMFFHDKKNAPQLPIAIKLESILKEAGHEGFSCGKGLTGIYQNVINPVVEVFEKGFETVLEKADNRFLFVAHQVNLLRNRYTDPEKLDQLPCEEELFQQYINELERVLTPQKWEYAKRLLLILAAGEEAFQADFNRNSSFATDAEWKGLSMAVLSKLMGEPHTDSVRFIFIIYSLKEVLSTWRKENHSDALYSLGLKDFTSVIRKAWQAELSGLHRSIAENFWQEWQGRFNEVNMQDPGEYYCLRYLLAHAELGEDERLKDKIWSDQNLAATLKVSALNYLHAGWNLSAIEFFSQEVTIRSYLVNINKHISDFSQGKIEMIHKLAISYMNKSSALRNQGRLAESISNSNFAIDLMEDLLKKFEVHGQWPAEIADNLAGAYMNRGNSLRIKGNLNMAISNYKLSINLREYLRENLEFNGKWSSEMTAGLARVYANRGLASKTQGNLNKSVTDYKKAIDLMENQQKKHNGEWSTDLTKDLAMAYIYLGHVLKSQGNLDQSVANNNAAIDLMMHLRRVLEPTGHWTPEMAKALSDAYTSRGNTLQLQGHHGQSILDYKSGISILEDLQKKLEVNGQWTPAMANDLAIAYMNKGIGLQQQDNLALSMSDYKTAIHMMEHLCENLEPNDQWIPLLFDSLAGAYINKGNLLQTQKQLDLSIADYEAAIYLRERIRKMLEPNGDWTPAMANGLAKAYGSKGNALQRQGHKKLSLCDYKLAIDLREDIRKKHEPAGQWTPEMVNGLALLYMNKANIIQSQGNLDQALLDYQSAIDLMQQLREQLEARGQWQFNMAYTLINAYITMSITLQAQGNIDLLISHYKSLISLLKEVKVRFEPNGQWTLEMAHVLILSYLKKGDALQKQGHLAQSISDYEQATFLSERLVFSKESGGGISFYTEAFWQKVVAAEKLKNQQEIRKAVKKANEFLMKLKQRFSFVGLPVQFRDDLAGLQNLINISSTKLKKSARNRQSKKKSR